jgi:CRISPR/Cas system CMR subunit Cmr4 (Cas7 group RAMP superfamily)
MRRREAKGVKGPGAVASEQRSPGSQILYSKTRRVKFHRTRIVSCKTTNRKKVMNHGRSHKNIRKAKGAMSTGGTHR